MDLRRHFGGEEDLGGETVPALIVGLHCPAFTNRGGGGGGGGGEGRDGESLSLYEGTYGMVWYYPGVLSNYYYST